MTLSEQILKLRLIQTAFSWRTINLKDCLQSMQIVSGLVWLKTKEAWNIVDLQIRVITKPWFYRR